MKIYQYMTAQLLLIINVGGKLSFVKHFISPEKVDCKNHV